MAATGKRVALYTRVSTEDQAREGFSLAAQRERLHAYCTAKDAWDVVEVYSDEGFSGRDTKRPAYRRMMEEMDRWDVVLVLKMDRIHRNAKNFMVMMERLQEADKEFASAMESFDTTTAMGRFVVDIIQRIAQLESEQIGERVYMGMRQKHQEGGNLGAPAPYGYEYADGREGNGGEARLVVVPEEADVVRRIYARYMGGDGLKEIVQALEEEGVPTKRGGRWDKRTVSKILKNVTYAGFHEWHKKVLPGDHEAIVDVETFDAVQRRLADRAPPAFSYEPRLLSAVSG